MKSFLISLCLWAGVAGQSLAQQTTVVNRWVSPVVKDFMSYPESIYTDQQLISWGYTQKPFSLRLTLKDPTATMQMPNCGVGAIPKNVYSSTFLCFKSTLKTNAAATRNAQ